jgi:hypothetical protein
MRIQSNCLDFLSEAALDECHSLPGVANARRSKRQHFVARGHGTRSVIGEYFVARMIAVITSFVGGDDNMTRVPSKNTF